MKGKSKLVLLMGAVCSALVACTQGDFDKMIDKTVDSETPYVYPDSIQDLGKVVFLDTREKEEYEVSHLPNAKFVGYKDFDLSEVEGIEKDSKIVVYCSIGYRSGEVGEQLIDAGFTNVTNLYGGIFKWVNMGYSVENAEGPTENIHGYNRLWKRWVKKGRVQL